MHRHEKMTLLTAVVIAICLCRGVLWCSNNSRGDRNIVPPAKEIAVSASYLLAGVAQYRGSDSCKFTLIEFSDYQCPPCRGIHHEVDAMLARFHAELKLTVRQLPLPIHMYALPAATAAEAAAEQGKFWAVNDQLFEAPDLDEKSIHAIAAQDGLNMTAFDRARETSAKSKVAADLVMSKRLNINSTPSFLLCCPDGSVFRLARLSQINDIIGAM